MSISDFKRKCIELQMHFDTMEERNDNYMSDLRNLYVHHLNMKFPKYVTKGKSLQTIKSYLFRKDEEFYTSLEEDIELLRDRHYNEFAKIKDALEKELNEIASKTEPIPGDEWNFVSCIHESNYATQGWGAMRYAKFAAKEVEMKFNHYGIETRVENPPKSITVYAKTSDICIQLIKRKKDISLVEWVAACWKNGVNPRVYNAFLPHGFEAEHGIKMC